MTKLYWLQINSLCDAPFIPIGVSIKFMTTVLLVTCIARAI